MHPALAAGLAVGLWSLRAAAQDFQFMPPPAPPSTSLVPLGGASAGYAAGGDFDGDGRPDLVIPRGNGLDLFLRTATDWVWRLQLIPYSRQRPVPFDLDGDGNLDLVLVPPFVPSDSPLIQPNYPIRVFRGVGGGGLVGVTLPAIMTGVTVAGVAIGDVDSNGTGDMIVATPSGASGFQSIVLVRSDAALNWTIDGTATPTGLPFGLCPNLLDADGDTRLDVLASNASSGMRLLRNIGGSFVDATASLPPIRIGHTFLAAADLDGDGRDDCAALLPNGVVDVLWGGPGGFTFQTSVAVLPGTLSLLPGDFDGDGDFDLIAPHSRGFDVIRSLGGRTFASSGLVDEPVLMVGVADMDADGVADVPFVTQASAGTVRCKWRARFEAAALVRGWSNSTQSPAVQAAGDVDGDGDTDFFSLNRNELTVDYALGGGSYRTARSPVTLSDTGEVWWTQLADMDGDGDLDSVLRSDSNLRVATNLGSSGFQWTLVRAIPSQPTDNVRVADIDRDGDQDILLAGSPGITLVRNLGNRQFAPNLVLVAANTPVHCLELADVDADGDLDLITDAIATSGLTHVIAANDGVGNFTTNSNFAVNLGSNPTAIAAADFDGDGHVDLAAHDDALRIFRNNGNGVFADRSAFDLPPGASPVATNPVAADLDDDGDIDIAVMGVLAPRCTLLLNDGTGHFLDRSAQRCAVTGTVGGSSPGHGILRAADIDDDGDVDLMAADRLQRVVLINHIRQCRSSGVPRIGGIFSIDLLSGPGFGTNGIVALGGAFAPALRPMHLPGVLGTLMLDPSSLEILGATTTDAIGVTSMFVQVPAVSSLYGLEGWFQGAVLPQSGPAGFTNSLYEIVIR